MPRKPIKPLVLNSDVEFKEFLKHLWDELYWATTYYDLFKGLLQSCKENKTVFELSPHFWDYTLRAHYQTALVYLHRIYDQNQESFSLHRFLLTVREHHRLFDEPEVRKRRQHDPNAEDLIKEGVANVLVTIASGSICWGC
jgi:hypothetical protein